MTALETRVPLGATVTSDGVRFGVWAPTAHAIEVVLEDEGGHGYPLNKTSDGFFEGRHPTAHAGTLYRFRVDGQGPYPDPASRFQPQGVHGPSQVVNLQAFSWSDHGWKGVALKDLVLYELHVGTFTPQGTFAGVMERLPYLAELGISAIELMPVADFAGARNWGYDGVSLFSPSHHYGTPEEFQRLVNRAHELGLGVILDVVYNHLGPDGNYLAHYSPFYFTPKHHTPWGQAINLDGDHADDVRAFLIQNALHWIADYHLDGLRLDATHALMDDSQRHFLAELSTRVRAESPTRSVLLIAEDCRNLAHMLHAESEGGLGLDAVWADDLHHQIRASITGDHEGYYKDFTGSLDAIADTVRQGWFFKGQHSAHAGAPRGTDPSGIPFERFVVCLQNHDQIGNRAFGERLNHQVDAPTYRAASTLLLTVPETPLLFMGQEWSADSPFQFFTDHSAELGPRVTEGRRAEFKAFSAFSDPAARERIPDPQLPATFERSHLQWAEAGRPPHAQVLRLYQRLLQWRKKELSPLERGAEDFSIRVLNGNGLWLEYRRGGQRHVWIVFQWKDAGRHELGARGMTPPRCVLTTEDSDVSPDPQPIVFLTTDSHIHFEFQRPGAVILQW